MIGTFRGSVLLNERLDWDGMLSWVSFWFTGWNFSWHAHLAGTLGGTAWKVIFQIYLLAI